jgi:hypothetical protein
MAENSQIPAYQYVVLKDELCKKWLISAGFFRPTIRSGILPYFYGSFCKTHLLVQYRLQVHRQLHFLLTLRQLGLLALLPVNQAML